MPFNVLDAIPIAVWQTDNAGEMLFRNTKFKHFLGTQIPVWESVLHPEDLASFMLLLRDQTNTTNLLGDEGIVEIDTRLKGMFHSDYRWHRVSRCPVLDASSHTQSGWVMTLVDINAELTEIKEGKGRESIYREVVNFCEGPIVTADNDGLIVSFNRSAENLFQYKEDEVLGHSINILMPPELAKHHDMYLKNYTSTGHLTAMGRSRTLSGIRKDGSRMPITLMLSDFEKDKQHFYIACIQEIHTEDNIQRQIRESKSAFISTISHELRTPMFGIMGITSLLANKGQYSREQLEYFKCLEASSKSMMLLVNNIVDYYCIQNGLVHENRTCTKINMLVADLYDTFFLQVSERVKMVVEADKSVPLELLMDSSLVKQVAYNLISNACKFTEQGSITIRLELTESASDSSQLHLRLVVIDTGIGISPAFSNHMFELFAQENWGNSRAFGGLGLGLAVCKEFVSILRGNITFKSILSVGSEFTVSVPVAIPSPLMSKFRVLRRDSGTTESPSPTNSTSKNENRDSNNKNNNDTTNIDNEDMRRCSVLSTSSDSADLLNSGKKLDNSDTENGDELEQKRILIVDDNALNQKVLKKMLHDMGWEVTPASDGKEALQALFGKDCFTLPRTASFESSTLPRPLSSSAPAALHASQPLPKSKRVSINPIPLLDDEDAVLALDYWKFDLIIMDIQMPVMDGYEATNHIRAWEEAVAQRFPALVISSPRLGIRFSSALHIPIIALTAVATNSEQASIDAGMDVFIKKPVTKNLLTKYIDLLQPM